MKPQMHYGEADCPVSPPSSFPKDDELNFEIEMIDFSKVKARFSSFTSMSLSFVNCNNLTSEFFPHFMIFHEVVLLVIRICSIAFYDFYPIF